MEDRPVDDLELKCIAKSLAELRKQKEYVKLLEEKEVLEKEIKSLCGMESEKLCEAILKIRIAEYEIGWWDGKAFQTIYHKLTNE